MNVLTAIKQRREITQFKADPLPQNVLDQLTQALYLSPAGNNIPSREFILVTEKEMLRNLTPATPFMTWLEHAAAAFVIIGNPDESKYWLQDATLAGGFLWLAAESLGVGAAWGAIYHSEDAQESSKRENHIRRHLGVPDDLRIVAVIGLGYPAVQPPAKTLYPIQRVLHHEVYNREKNS